MNLLFFLTPKQDVLYIYEDFTLRQTLEKWANQRFATIPVLKRNGEYVGTITEGDILWGIKNLHGLDLEASEDVPISSFPRRRDYKAVTVTTEGRELSRQLAALGIEVTVSVATPLGQEEQGSTPGVTVRCGRLLPDEMAALLGDAALCIDATHPYAVEATKNIKAAAEKAGVGYLRLLRPASPLPENCLVFESAKQAAEALAAKEGNLLLATGAKELAQFAAIPPERLYPRVLPTLESIAACEAANIPHRNIIAMQGPFSFALNQAMMEQFHIRWLVTKDGGAAGGFDEKAAAASAAGAQLVVIRRPPEQGETASEVLKRCKEMIR